MVAWTLLGVHWDAGFRTGKEGEVGWRDGVSWRALRRGLRTGKREMLGGQSDIGEERRWGRWGWSTRRFVLRHLTKEQMFDSITACSKCKVSRRPWPSSRPASISSL